MAPWTTADLSGRSRARRYLRRHNLPTDCALSFVTAGNSLSYRLPSAFRHANAFLAVVVHDGRVLEKPADEDEVRRNIASYAVSLPLEGSAVGDSLVVTQRCVRESDAPPPECVDGIHSRQFSAAPDTRPSELRRFPDT